MVAAGWRASLLLCAGLSAGLAAAQEAPSQAGGLRGTVYDKDFEVPLAQVRVSVIEALVSTLSAADGHFAFEKLPPGSYTLSLAKDGYERQLVPGVVVAAGRLTDLRADLSSEVIELEEMVVTGVDLLGSSEVGLLEIRAEAVSVQDAISSELMSKAGVGEVSGALRLVVGASVVDGKYATVRGLSDRYTGTTLNGVRVPSADPRRRAAQVDLFPTGTIESVTVHKTFTPELQGDFTGGGVDIKTRSIPDGPLFSFSESYEHNTLATGNGDFLGYSGGGVDPFAFHSSDRDLPAIARTKLPPLPAFSARPTAQQMEASRQWDAFTRSFAPAIGVSRTEAGPNYGLSLSAGNRLDLGDDMVLGILGSVTYARKYDFYDRAQNNNAVVADASQPLTPSKQREDARGIDEVLMGMLASFVLQPKVNHEVSLKLVYNQSAEDEARFQEEELGATSVEQNQSLRYTERLVGSAQIHGSHAFSVSPATIKATDLMVDWSLSFNETRQDEPDVRFFRNVFDETTQSGGQPPNSTSAQNSRRIFREIEEGDIQAAANASFPVRLWGSQEGQVKAGLFHEASARRYGQRSFAYQFPRQFGSPFHPVVAANLAYSRFEADEPGELWTDEFLFGSHVGLAWDPNTPAKNQLLWVLSPLGDDVDYDGDQTIDAAYGMIDLPVGDRFRFTGGARYETTSISIDPENKAFGKVDVIQVLASGDRGVVEVPQEEARADIDDGALLPSLGVIYTLRQGMDLRLSWSRTIARPTFRELAPVATEEFIFGDEFIGNPDLKVSDITNYDLRWEWFFRSGDVLAVSAFYKELQDPIELISFAAGGRSFIQPVNFDHGTVQGIEVEARAALQPIAAWLSGVTAGVNFTLIDSEVEVPDFEKESLAPFELDEDLRRLQGQPEYLVNVNLTYDRDASGTSVSLFYNRIGETLVTGAARGSEDGVPNVFEKSYGTLDLTASQRLGDYLTVSFKARNVAREDRESVYRLPDGEEAVKTLRRTPSLYSLALSVKW